VVILKISTLSYLRYSVFIVCIKSSYLSDII
jgi:hypothetical protein